MWEPAWGSSSPPSTSCSPVGTNRCSRPTTATGCPPSSRTWPSVTAAGPGSRRSPTDDRPPSGSPSNGRRRGTCRSCSLSRASRPVAWGAASCGAWSPTRAAPPQRRERCITPASTPCSPSRRGSMRPSACCRACRSTRSLGGPAQERWHRCLTASWRSRSTPDPATPRQAPASRSIRPRCRRTCWPSSTPPTAACSAGAAGTITWASWRTAGCWCASAAATGRPWATATSTPVAAPGPSPCATRRSCRR